MNLVILEDKFECTLLSLLKDFRKRGMSSWQPAGGLAVLLVRNTGPGQESERGKRPKQEEHTNLGPMPRSSTRLECDDQTPIISHLQQKIRSLSTFCCIRLRQPLARTVRSRVEIHASQASKWI